MEMTIKKLSELSGVSTRTLRYYDEIGLLKPKRISSNGYRIYGQPEIDRLQQILFYRQLDFPLSEIEKILSAPNYDKGSALSGHLSALLARRQELDSLIKNVELSIMELKGEYIMTNEEKFQAFKTKHVCENEEKYGDEIRQKYGDDAIESSNSKVLGMSQNTWTKQEQLSMEIAELIKSAMVDGDPACASAQEACDKHRQWLCLFWKDGTYSKDAHKAMAEMYVTDERFKAYYDNISDGFADFFKSAIDIYCK